MNAKIAFAFAFYFITGILLGVDGLSTEFPSIKDFVAYIRPKVAESSQYIGASQTESSNFAFFRIGEDQLLICNSSVKKITDLNEGVLPGNLEFVIYPVSEKKAGGTKGVRTSLNKKSKSPSYQFEINTPNILADIYSIPPATRYIEVIDKDTGKKLSSNESPLKLKWDETTFEHTKMIEYGDIERFSLSYYASKHQNYQMVISELNGKEVGPKQILSLPEANGVTEFSVLMIDHFSAGQKNITPSIRIAVRSQSDFKSIIRSFPNGFAANPRQVVDANKMHIKWIMQNRFSLTAKQNPSVVFEVFLEKIESR